MKSFKKFLRLFKLYSIYNLLRNIYLFLAPKGTKRYKISHKILSTSLKQFSILNITYREYLRSIGPMTNDDSKTIKIKIDEMVRKPSFSVIMPVYNPNLNFLEQAILSVQNQAYPYWELCIADDASTDPRVPALLLKFAQEDPRIKVILREQNGHISAASNSALELASHDFIALLDHDDLLHPLALFYVAQVINQYPESEIIYSDEDKITRRGKRLDPYFKPDFNYELLLSHNMVSHLGVYRTTSVRKIGGFQLGLEGSQDYDLLLRMVENCNHNQIHHIPRILYHWRISHQSVAENIAIKPYAIQAAEKAISDHLTRRSIEAKVDFIPDLAAFQVKYALPENEPSVNFIIHTKEFSEKTVSCIDSILDNTKYSNYKIILCNPKNIEQKWHEYLVINQQKVSSYLIEEDNNHSFARVINQCVSECTSEYVCLLDQALTGFHSGWLSTLMGQAVQSGIGAVAPKLIYNTDTVFSNGIILLPDNSIKYLFNGKRNSDAGYFGWAKITRGYSALSEKCLLVNRQAFQSVEGFTKTIYNKMNCGVDFCLKLKELGFRNIITPMIVLFINKNSDNKNKEKALSDQYEADMTYLKARWSKWFQRDPAFNQNLTFFDESRLGVNLSAPRITYYDK